MRVTNLIRMTGLILMFGFGFVSAEEPQSTGEKTKGYLCKCRFSDGTITEQFFENPIGLSRDQVCGTIKRDGVQIRATAAKCEFQRKTPISNQPV